MSWIISHSESANCGVILNTWVLIVTCAMFSNITWYLSCYLTLLFPFFYVSSSVGYSSCIIRFVPCSRLLSPIFNNSQSVKTTWWQRCTMAGIRLQPPEPFNFRNPDDWQRWKRRFQQFREASGLDESAETKQVSTLLYSLGEEAEAVLTSMNTTDAERKEYKKVLEKFDSFFQVRKNVIYE